MRAWGYDPTQPLGAGVLYIGEHLSCNEVRVHVDYKTRGVNILSKDYFNPSILWLLPTTSPSSTSIVTLNSILPPPDLGMYFLGM